MSPQLPHAWSRCAWVAALLLLASFLAAPAAAQQPELDTLTPEETLFVTDFASAAVSRDFSPFLGDLRVEWLILSEGEDLNSTAAAQKDLLLIGTLSSPAIGPALRDLLSASEIARIETQGWAFLEKDHPWEPGRAMLLAVGVDLLGTKSAAETAAAALLDASPSRASWFRQARAVGQEELRASTEQVQQTPTGSELTIEQLTADPDQSRPRSVSAEEAAADVAHLFQLLKDGWCGYGTFAAQASFSEARDAALQQLAERNRWSPDALAALLRENLSFIHDCHLRIGNVPYCSHLDFWYDDTLSFWPAADSFQFDLDGVGHQLLQVNEEAPEPFLFPSLNAAGEPIYRLGMLSYDPPPPLRLSAAAGDAPVQLELPLTTAEYNPWKKFGDQRLGGIPVIRARSFADAYADEMNDFVATAKQYHGEPYLILDIRGNGGGNTRWPKAWIRSFTGGTPALKQVLTELVSQTTMMGRANLFAEMKPDPAGSVEAEQSRYLALANQLAGGAAAPHWSGLIFPDTRRIPNDTTLIVVVDRQVASSGEGLLSYLHTQVENVLIVGENSLGALTFGQVSLHQLPNSRLKAYVPIKLNLPLDLVWREERGFMPNLWLPPDQALNYVAAAVRAGTITTQVAIPEGYFAGPFNPENVWWLRIFGRTSNLPPLLIMLTAVVVAAVRVRKEHRFPIAAGLLSIMMGLFYILRFNQPVGYAAILLGGGSIAFGFYWRRRLNAAAANAFGNAPGMPSSKNRSVEN